MMGSREHGNEPPQNSGNL